MGRREGRKEERLICYEDCRPFVKAISDEGKIAQRLGRKALAEVAVVAKPETILGWFRKLVARKS